MKFHNLALVCRVVSVKRMTCFFNVSCLSVSALHFLHRYVQTTHSKMAQKCSKFHKNVHKFYKILHFESILSVCFHVQTTHSKLSPTFSKIHKNVQKLHTNVQKCILKFHKNVYNLQMFTKMFKSSSQMFTISHECIQSVCLAIYFLHRYVQTIPRNFTKMFWNFIHFVFGITIGNASTEI